MECKCRYCHNEFEAELPSRVCDLCRKRVGTKFMLIFDPSPDDCTFTYHGLFNIEDTRGEHMKGCKFRNMRTGEIIEV